VGALTAALSKWPRPDVPAALLVAWAVWILGGLLLMLWFTRRSASRRHAVATRPSATVVARHGSSRTAARRASTVLAAAVEPGPRLPSPVRVPDAYSELSSLLDSTNDPPTGD
jgi:hypothetical protein